MVGVTLLAIPLGYVGRQVKVVQEWNPRNAKPMRISANVCSLY
jgi:hypothetical protein